MMIERITRRRVTDLLGRHPVVGLLGSRQVGKTTLALEIAGGRPSVYLDLESPADRAKLGEPELYLAAQDGPLACERMLDVLEKLSQSQKDLPKPGVAKRLAGWSLWALRTRIKRYKDSRPGSHNKPEFQRHRYPAVALEDMRARASRFQQLLGYSNELKVERFCKQFFRIRPE